VAPGGVSDVRRRSWRGPRRRLPAGASRHAPRTVG
jgi:hypothetical protein